VIATKFFIGGHLSRHPARQGDPGAPGCVPGPAGHRLRGAVLPAPGAGLHPPWRTSPPSWAS
jgi:hypothetical protein